MNLRKSKFVLFLVFALTTLVMGCKPSVPRQFISEGKMEDILYDYHLADAMAHAQGNDNASNIVAYREAVLKKYGITQAEFDTSMVYYMRHTDVLEAIYKRIATRMENRARELGSSEGSLAGLGSYSASGDTADIWKGDRAMALIPSQPYNLYSFELTPDSTFRRGDSFALMMNIDFIIQDGARDGVAMMAVVFKNDSVAQRVLHLSSSSQYNITIDDNDSLGVKAVRGFFLFNIGQQATTSLSTLRLMAVSNIRLFRYRAKKRKEQAVPTDIGNATDSMRRGGRTGVVVGSDTMGRGSQPMQSSEQPMRHGGQPMRSDEPMQSRK